MVKVSGRDFTAVLQRGNTAGKCIVLDPVYCSLVVGLTPLRDLSLLIMGMHQVVALYS